MRAILEGFLIGNHLSFAEAQSVMGRLMDGELTHSQIGALLVALRMKHETPEEIAGFVTAMRERAIPVSTRRFPLIDTCGTGGDTHKTFNISTASAFVAAGANVAIAKHGNRAVTGKHGSADVLEALGVRLDLSPEAVGESIDRLCIGFLFARNHHPAMKHAAPIRAELQIRTIFNLLGPLTNPARATRQVIGVYDKEMVPIVAQTIALLGTEHTLVVHGDGLDEIGLWNETDVAEIVGEQVLYYKLSAEMLGLPYCLPADLLPADNALKNAALLTDVLSGNDKGARRHIVLANSAAALYVGGVVDSLADGVRRAAETIDSGAAIAKLNELRDFTNRNYEKG